MMGKQITFILSCLYFLMSALVLSTPSPRAQAGTTVLYEDFENGSNGWSSDAGVWEVGNSSVGGPPGAPEPNSCAATNLTGRYPRDTDSRFISPPITLPEVGANELIQLRFWEWYSYVPGTHPNAGDYGQVQVSTDDGATWSDPLATPAPEGGHSDWSYVCVPLTEYAGQEIRVAFRHIANYRGFWTDEDSGWYVDEVEVWCAVPSVTLPEGFENGWGDWCTDHGVWQLGEPSYGPGGAYNGVAVAGTNLSGVYPRYTDSSLISPPIRLPEVGANKSLQLCFWEWYSYRPGGHPNAGDYGDIQVSTDGGATWSDPLATPAPEGGNSDWSYVEIPLTEYASQQIRIAFRHIADYRRYDTDEAAGWYIDDVKICIWPPGGIDVEPPYDQSGEPGDTLTYEFKIFNYQDQEDTFDLVPTSKHRWPISVKPDSVTVAPGGGDKTVQVEIRIPERTLADDTYQLTLTATSQSDDSVSASASVNTTVLQIPSVRVMANDSAIRGDLGETVHFQFAIENSGNGTDTFDISAVSEHGWAMAYPNGQVVGPLEAGASTTDFQVDVTIPNDTAASRDVLTLTATSQFDNGVSDNGTVTTHVKPFRESSITVPAESQPQSITYSHEVTRSGTLTAEREPESGDFQPLAGQTVTVVFTPRSGQVASVQGSAVTESSGRFQVTVRLTQVGAWDAEAKFNGSFDTSPGIARSTKDYDQPIEVAAATGILTLNAGSERLWINQSTRIWGALSTDQVGLRIPNARIILNVSGPASQGNGQTVETTTNEQGEYSFGNFPSDFPSLNPIPFSDLGEWRLQASFESGKLKPDQSPIVSIGVFQSGGYAIIVAGKVESGEGLLDHSFSANKIYRTFMARGFAQDKIRYLNFDTDQTDNCDPRGKNNSDINVFGEATKANIRDAIVNWAKQKMDESQGPLYVVLTDHGLGGDQGSGEPPGMILDGDVLRADDLAAWLDELDNSLDPGSQETSVPEVIVYGACYSGGFIPYLSKPGRIIITSAAENERSYRGPSYPGCSDARDGEFFLSEFFKHISNGITILNSFRLATKATEAYTVFEDPPPDPNAISTFFDKGLQHPLLDDNGDEIGSNIVWNLTGTGGSADGGNSNFVVGESIAGPTLPEILEVCGERFLSPSDNRSFRDYENDVVPEQYLWANVNDTTLVDTAFIEIRPPGSKPEGLESETMQLEREVYLLEADRMEGSTYIWENFNRRDVNGKQFDGFGEPGAYEIAYYVQDAETGNLTAPVVSWVYRNKEGNNAPRPFNLRSPVDGAKRVARSPVFDWEDTVDPDKERGDGDITYTLIITPIACVDPGAKQIVVSGIKASAYSFDEDPEAAPPLADLAVYEWMVIAIDPYGGKRFCNENFSFTTDEPNGIRGRLHIKVVEDGSDKLVQGCWIKITGAERSEEWSDYGTFSGTVPQGSYNVKVRAPGYEEKIVKNVQVKSLDTTERTVRLTPLPKPTSMLKTYLCVERFGLAIKGGNKDKLQIRGLINVRRPVMSVFAEDEQLDFKNRSLVIEIDDFRRILLPDSLKENPPGSARYVYKDKANGIRMKLSLYVRVNSTKGAFAISVVSSLAGIDPASDEIRVRLRNGDVDTMDPLVMSNISFDQSCIFKPEHKGQSARFVLGKTGKLIQPRLCISRVSISEKSKPNEALKSIKFSIRGAVATEEDNALNLPALYLPDSLCLRFIKRGVFTDIIDERDLGANKRKYTFKAKGEGITSLVIDAEKGAFRISGLGKIAGLGDDAQRDDVNPVEIVLEIGDDDKRETNIDMVKSGKRLVY